MNSVILTGRFTHDPEIRYTDSKKAVVSFQLAVDNGKDRDGKKRTVYVPCVAWEKTAELIDQYFSKGDGIALLGKIQSRSYEKDGKKHTVYEVLVSGIEFPLSRKPRDDEKQEPVANAFEDYEDDEDLPF